MTKKLVFIISILIFGIIMYSQNKETNSYQKSLVDYDAFETLVKEVKEHRAKRLISLDNFLASNKTSEFIILDTRSEKMYQQKHLKGAIHLNFSDFNQVSLKELIPNLDAKILIYCNNNIKDDALSFITKTTLPKIAKKDIKPITLALNIPTYINLYGYGYRNVFELDELISVFDNRIQFEGTEVFKISQKN